MAFTGTGSDFNPLGAVCIYDNEAPSIFTARVIKTVSGGQFVACSGTLGNLGSAANQVTPSQFNVYASIDGYCNGIALYNVASGTNNYVAVARKGVFLVKAGGPCSGGCSVILSSGGMASVEAVGSVNIIGRSFNSTDEGAFGALSLNC